MVTFEFYRSQLEELKINLLPIYFIETEAGKQSTYSFG